MLDKLKKSNNSTGNKLDVTGGKILGNLNILDNAYFGKNGVAFGAPYDTNEGGSLQVDGAKIIESGSNENGSWTKWSDGTMICRNKVDNIAIETKQNMSNKNIIYYGYANDGWTYFPQKFIEPPTTILNSNTGSNCFGIQPYEQQYSDRPPGFYPLSVDPTLTGVISISYIAIGKWK